MTLTLLLTRLGCNFKEVYSRIYYSITHYSKSKRNFGLNSGTCLFKSVLWFGFRRIHSTLCSNHIEESL